MQPAERKRFFMTNEELGSLILASQGSLYRVAKTILSDDDDCYDAIHEAIVTAFSGLDSLRNDSYAKTWLTRILINECYMILRRRNKVILSEDIPEQKIYEQPDHSDLYEAVAGLPAKMRTAVTLYYSEGFSVKEIADITESTESAIKNRLFRARTRLRQTLERDEQEVTDK